ncbi:MAG: type II toxin-antitoxin system RelE/ParE family toxin [Thermomicrobiales bacterium]|nr:type II toxin-antitoxin system RelE/ParE family toxin [Thermomicrobiales bacterium]
MDLSPTGQRRFGDHRTGRAGVGPTVGRFDQRSRHKNMKELRPGSVGASELRILFIFDPERRAILLMAGDKRGQWKAWYRRSIPIADRRDDVHRQDLKT